MTPPSAGSTPGALITGAHFLLYSDSPALDRAFLRDVLELPAIDVGGGWLIFGLPKAEAAVHPTDGDGRQTHAGHTLMGAVLYLMCDDLGALVRSLAAKGVECGPQSEEPWGTRTTIPMPGGAALGVYQPRHATALDLWGAAHDGTPAGRQVGGR